MKIEVKNRGGSRVLPDGILLSETVRHVKVIAWSDFQYTWDTINIICEITSNNHF